MKSYFAVKRLNERMSSIVSQCYKENTSWLSVVVGGKDLD